MKRALSLLLLAAVASTGCGGSSDTSAAAFLQSIQGTWVSPCVPSPGSYVTETWTFSGTGFTVVQRDYANTSCSGAPVDTTTGTGTVGVGASVQAPFGAGGVVVTANPMNLTLTIGTETEYDFDLGYVDTAVIPNRLYLGLVDAAHDGLAPDRRPVVIDPGFYSFRQ